MAAAQRRTHHHARAAVAALLAVGALACAQVPGPAAPAGVSGHDDGVIDDLLSPFAASVPALANLDRDLLSAVQQAARDAQSQGIEIAVTSGWRSRAYQQDLWDEAIVTYGSEAEARRRVATPETSRHVTGDAVDIGPTDAAYWVGQHGADYGLCQTYANEIWHFELSASPGGTCPDLLLDASA